MKKKRRAARKQLSSTRPDQEQPTARPGDENPPAKHLTAAATRADAIKNVTAFLRKSLGHGPATFPRVRSSASRLLVLSQVVGARRLKQIANVGSPLRLLLHECATGSLEKHCATWLPLDSPLALLASASNPLIKNKLIFRGFVVPTLCEATVRVAGKLPLKMSLFLRDYSARVRALERLGWEMMIRGAGSEGIQIGGKARRLPERARDFGQLPLPTLDWLVANSDDASQWLERFDAWHQAALKSFNHFHLQFCADMGYQDPGKAFAAYLGLAESKTPLLPELVSLLNRQPPLTSSIMSKLFAKNVADPRSTKYGRKFEKWVRSGKCGQRPGLVIDCWLVEIWPLVVAEEWGYTAIQQIAEAKFGVHNSLEKPKQLEKRCQKLQLKLADKSARGGAGICFKYPLPPLACLAAHVKGIAEQSENWMHGQRGS